MVGVLHPIPVTDAADPRVDDFRDLSRADRRPDRPGGRGLVIAEGTVVVERMVGSRFRPFALMGTASRLDRLADLPFDGDVPYYLVDAETFAAVVGFHLNRGVLALAHQPDPLDPWALAESARTVAVLEGVNDHENLGALFRNAAGLGVDAVLLGPAVADPLYRRAVRVSMGHVLRVPYAQLPVDDWPGGLHRLRDLGFDVVALTPDDDALPIDTALRGRRVAVMLGAEGPGLSDAALAAATVRARIPMHRNTDSLNVATAAAIAFYERAR